MQFGYMTGGAAIEYLENQKYFIYLKVTNRWKADVPEQRCTALVLQNGILQIGLWQLPSLQLKYAHWLWKFINQFS